MNREKTGQSIPLARRDEKGSLKTRTLKGGATPNERKRYRTRQFQGRVAVVLLLIGTVVYLAWFSPWSKPVRTLDIQIGTNVVGH